MLLYYSVFNKDLILTIMLICYYFYHFLDITAAADAHSIVAAVVFFENRVVRF